jgi:ABC-2 type transport system ATP-binding protein
VSAIIEVENLTKYYGNRLALDAATFAVQPGQIVGFLGPNGAGKSTTLRILTGYLPATGGTARVAGHDVLLESLAVRSNIGYMPENVPLYPEMRVEEYLKLRAGLKDVPSKQRKAAVDRVIERCWLQERRRSLIGSLSKGLRQRVGLAEALVADPQVLILDEPTIGLDPVQIQETRKLIRSLGEKHTVLLSSHHLTEVEKTCSHLVIIADGRIKATGSVEQVREGLAEQPRIVLELKKGRSTDGPAEMARALGQVQGAAIKHEDMSDGWTRFIVLPPGQADPREALYDLIIQRGWRLREMRRQVPSLEELYTRITESTTGGHVSHEDKGAA